jgi:hypothetical protein
VGGYEGSSATDLQFSDLTLVQAFSPMEVAIKGVTVFHKLHKIYGNFQGGFQ